jgi:hypothetical protein
MSKWKLLDLTVIYIPVYTVVHVNQYFKNDRFASWRKQSYYHSWFYDNVEELSLEERAEMAKAPLA